MYDSDYDRQIVRQIDNINRRFIAHQRAVGRARMINGGADVSSGLAGGSFLDKIPLVGNVAHMFGLGDTGAGMEGGSFLNKIPIVGNIASMFGLGETGAGETGAGRKKRVYKKKGGAELLNMVDKSGGSLSMFGLGETGAGRKKLGRAITGSADTGAGRKKRVYRKKGGADPPYVDMSDAYPVPPPLPHRQYHIATSPGGTEYIMPKPEHIATSPGGTQYIIPREGNGMAGGSFLDKIPVVGSLASMFGLGETGAGRKKVHKKRGKGIEDALEGGRGTKAGAKKNPWVAHVKAVAAKNGISYKEALKVAKSSY